jgi:hypothetical protein
MGDVLDEIGVVQVVRLEGIDLARWTDHRRQQAGSCA